MGLDQYLTASVFVPAVMYVKPPPHEVAKMDELEARLNENPFGITARVSPKPGSLPEPVPDPQYDALLRVIDIDPDRYRTPRAAVTVQILVGYWRKANQIHAWFAERHNLENDVDVSISRDELAELRQDCELVLADHSKAERLLPTQSGFFFGPTEYDEMYFQDLTDTIAIIDRVLTDPALIEADLHYRGWW